MARFVQLQQIGPGLYRAKAIIEGNSAQVPESVSLVEMPKDVSSNEILGSLYLNGEWLGKNTKGAFNNYDTTIKVSIIIPTFSGGEKLETCLKTFIAYHKSILDYEIIVVIDGGPHKEAIWQITSKYDALTIELSENLGFSAAVNAGLREVRPDSACVILVNDDIRFIMPACLVLANTLRQNIDTAIAGALLLYPDGRVQHAGVLSDFNHILRGKEPTEEAFLNREVWSVTGALFGISSKYLEQCGKFDERYKLAWEDTDFCVQARTLGWKVRYCGSAVAYHEEGGTRGNTPETKMKNEEWLKRDERGYVTFNEKWGSTKDPKLQGTKIIIRRDGAIGDVLLTTPIIRALKKKHTDSIISVVTDHSYVFRDNPYVSFTLPPDHFWLRDQVYNVCYDLSLSYEKSPEKHIIQSYADVCGINVSDWKMEIYTREQDERFADALLGSGEWIALHIRSLGWPGKEWSAYNFNRLSKSLRKKNFKVVLIGSGSSDVVSNDLDLRGKTTFHKLAAIIKKSKVLVGGDSLPLHLAQAVGTSAVGLFGDTFPDRRLIPGSTAIGITALKEKVACLGCHHRKEPPQVVGTCDCPSVYCMEYLTPEDVLRAVENVLNRFA